VSKPSLNRSVDLTSGKRKPSQRTIEILRFLASSKEPKGVREIADLVKGPYKSVHKTLRRLVKKGLVLEPSRGFYAFDHDRLCLFGTYTGDVSISKGGDRGGGRTPVQLHRVGLSAPDPRLWDQLLETGSLTYQEHGNLKIWRGRSLVKEADLRVSRRGAYYTRHSEPEDPRALVWFMEDFRKSLGHVTRGLATPEAFYLNDYELGLEIPDLFTVPFSRIVIYPKRGRIRIHVQPRGLKLKIPLGPEEVQSLETAMRRILEDLYVSLMNPLEPGPALLASLPPTLPTSH